MNRRLWLALFLTITLFGSEAFAKVKYNRGDLTGTTCPKCPGNQLASAQSECASALAALSSVRSFFDASGHAARALQLLEQANRELQAGVQAASSSTPSRGAANRRGSAPEPQAQQDASEDDAPDPDAMDSPEQAPMDDDQANEEPAPEATDF